MVASYQNQEKSKTHNEQHSECYSKQRNISIHLPHQCSLQPSLVILTFVVINTNQPPIKTLKPIQRLTARRALDLPVLATLFLRYHILCPVSQSECCSTPQSFTYPVKLVSQLYWVVASFTSQLALLTDSYSQLAI